MERRFSALKEAFLRDLGPALAELWRMRQAAREKSKEKSGRGEATSGRHMDPLSTLLVRFIRESGLEGAEFYMDRRAALPGYFRPIKTWDLAVVRDGALIMALELKSHIGSYGNNFNNRVEEALGSAVDLGTALVEGVLREHVPNVAGTGVMKPFRGWLMVLPWEEATEKTTKVPFTPLFPLDPAFLAKDDRHLVSYADRYKLFVQRTVLKGHYDAAALILSRPHSEDYASYNLDVFLRGLFAYSWTLAKSD
jgi:hypothetical protein